MKSLFAKIETAKVHAEISEEVKDIQDKLTSWDNPLTERFEELSKRLHGLPGTEQPDIRKRQDMLEHIALVEYYAAQLRDEVADGQYYTA